jgi:D-amino peptidase
MLDRAEEGGGGMQVLISVDMAGIAGVVDGDDINPDRIEREVPKALADRGSVRPLRFDGPVVLEVEVRRSRMTEYAMLVPGMQLADARTLRYAAPDFPTAYQVSELIALLGAQ